MTQTATGHTPGPWNIVDVGGGRRLQIHSRGAPLIVASVHDSDDRVGKQGPDGVSVEALANAHLIALAPELAAALREHMSVVDDHRTTINQLHSSILRLESKARALVARLDGDR